MPAAFWVGDYDSNFADARNWFPRAVPTSGDTLYFHGAADGPYYNEVTGLYDRVPGFPCNGLTGTWYEVHVGSGYDEAITGGDVALSGLFVDSGDVGLEEATMTAGVYVTGGTVLVGGPAEMAVVYQFGGELAFASTLGVSANLTHGGGTMTVGGAATVFTIDQYGGTITFDAEAEVGTLGISTGVVTFGSAAEIDALMQTGGTVTAEGEVTAGTVDVDGGRLGLEGGGWIDGADVSGGVVALGGDVAAAAFALVGGDVEQAEYADLTVTESFYWDDGDFNAAGNAANVFIRSASGTIDPGGGTLVTGSTIDVAGTEEQPAQVVALPGTVQFNNAAAAVIGDWAILQASTSQKGDVDWATKGSNTIRINLGGTFTVTGPGTFYTNKDVVNAGGTLRIEGGALASLGGGSTTSFGYEQSNGKLVIQNGSALTAPNDIYVYGGSIRTEMHPSYSFNQQRATINANLVFGGPFEVSPVPELFIDKGPVSGTTIYGALDLNGNVEWKKGKYTPHINGTTADISNRWYITGSLQVTSGAIVAPITQEQTGGGVLANSTWTILTASPISGAEPVISSGALVYSLAKFGSPTHTWKLAT